MIDNTIGVSFYTRKLVWLNFVVVGAALTAIAAVEFNQNIGATTDPSDSNYLITFVVAGAFALAGIALIGFSLPKMFSSYPKFRIVDQGIYLSITRTYQQLIPWSNIIYAELEVRPQDWLAMAFHVITWIELLTDRPVTSPNAGRPSRTSFYLHLVSRDALMAAIQADRGRIPFMTWLGYVLRPSTNRISFLPAGYLDANGKSVDPKSVVAAINNAHAEYNNRKAGATTAAA